MTESTNSTSAERILTAEEKRFLELGMAAAQTAYELNNGFGIVAGQPLRYIDDSAGLTTPGARPFKIAELDGFMVQGVFNDLETGLNAYIAYNKQTSVVLIGTAGTNGFGSDWPDTGEDLARLGTKQSLQLATMQQFRGDLQAAIAEVGGVSGMNKLLISGQSLGGGISPLLGLHLVNGSPGSENQDFYQGLGIKSEKIFVTSVNGFGYEYGARLAGFTAEQINTFTSEADLHRVVVQNAVTGEYDFVSQLGGQFSGTNWILPVELARGSQVHTFRVGISEGTDNLYGDLSLMKSGAVPWLDHDSLSRNLAWLDSLGLIKDNPVSLSWGGYVSMLFAQPGESSATISGALQSYAGMPKPIADAIGVVSELALRVLPVTQATQAISFLAGTFIGGQLIGSLKSPQPVFDINAAFGPVLPGWVRSTQLPDANNVPTFVIDTNPETRVQVIRRSDGRSVEMHPDGSEIQTHPQFGIAVLNPDGSGMLYLKSADPGDIESTTVALAPGSIVKPEMDGWRVITEIDKAAGLYKSSLYQQTSVSESEIQFGSDPSGSPTGSVSQTKPIFRELPTDILDLPSYYDVQPTAVRIDTNHVRFFLRDEDRRLVQTIDVIRNGSYSESIYRNAEGLVQKKVTVEQLNADATRTTTIGEDGMPTETVVVQRYRRQGELFELEDRIDNAEGVRILTVRDSEGCITKAETLPLDAKAPEYMDAVRDQLYDDIADFLTALRQKDTAGVILSTARIALDFARSQGIATLSYDTMVADASSGMALISSLRSLQSGDTMAKIGGAVGLLNSTNYFAARLTGSGYLSGAQSAALSQVGAILAIANLAHLGDMVEAGQIGSAGATVISAVNGIAYLSGASTAMMGSGALIAVNPIVMVGIAFLADSFFGDDPPPPPPKGEAEFYRDANGQLAFRISESNRLGERILERELSQLLPALEQQLAAANDYIGDDATRLNLIASRMPTIQISAWPTYEENGVDNYFFVLTQRDPMRDDPGYLALSRLDLVKLYAETLLLPEAIVQQWEFDHLRARFGNDESHWQSEGEWLRGRSPVERERSRLQGEADRALERWESASKLELFLDVALPAIGSAGNVKAIEIGGNVIDTMQQAMDAANAAVDAFNAAHPVDPLQAARATPEQEAAFAQASGAREAVALQWMKVAAIDLGNDGVQLIDLPGVVGSDLDSLREQHVARFDVDGNGFREATQWIAPSDAILGIDRNGNGLLDTGSELFNGADTPFDQHGFASLAYFDANGDGLITQEDPAYRQLRLWVDLDGDGSAGQLETFDLRMRSAALPYGAMPGGDLAAMAVEAIDLNASTLRFADGSSAAVVQLDLLAHAEGLRIVEDERTGNLNVLHEDGLRENFITLADDMAVLQELLSPTLAPARRLELEALASRYGLNPQSEDFKSIVQSLRAAGAVTSKQDTVIYFGDDDVWVDPAVRERLEQMRITFRKLGNAGSDTAGESQLFRIGQPLSAQALASGDAFDDRWVASRRVGAADIQSDEAVATADAESPTEQQPAHSDVYSLLAASKGEQVGGLDVRLPVIIGEPARAGAADGAPAPASVPQSGVTHLGVVDVESREDTRLSFDYQTLERAALRALASEDPSASLRLVGLHGASHGTVSRDDAAARVSFRPQADHAGEAGFACVLADRSGQLYEQLVRIRLQPLNDAPRVAGEAIASSEDVPLLIDPLALLANDRDVDGDTLEVTGIARVALGRAELLANGQIHYTPPSDQYGVVDTLDYIVQDSQGASAVARIRITLHAADDAPSVVSERVINAREDQVLRIAPRLLLRNDFDVDTDSRIGAGPLKITAVGSAAHGQVRMEHSGEIVFTADRDFNGEAGFSYTVMDESGMATTGRALLRIDPVNDGPLAAGEHIAGREDERLMIDTALLLRNDIDTDIRRGESQALSVVAVDAAVGGQVQLEDGMISFIPDANRSGSAGFRYTIGDGAGGFAQATVDIDLEEVNDAPVLPPRRFDAIEDTELALPAARLLEGATDVDGSAGALRVVSVGNGIGGSITLVDGQLRFRPSADFAGAGSFDYTVADALGAETTGIAAIDVNGINDAPVLLPGSRFSPVGNEDQEIRIAETALAKMFWDADGDIVKIATKSLAARNSQDRIRYDAKRQELVLRAAPNANGTRSFSYAMTDGLLVSATQTLTLKLRPVNDAPIVNAVGVTMLEDGGESNPTQSAWSYLSHELLLSGASDPEGDALKVVKVAGGRTAGVAMPAPVEILNDDAAGRVAIKAPLNYNGAIEFEFTVADGNGGETVQKAYGMVTAVNDAPYLTVQQSTTTPTPIFSNRTLSAWQIDAWDPDATLPVQLAVVRNPVRGTVTLGEATGASDPRGGFFTTAAISTDSGKGNTTTTETAWFSATDAVGAQSQISISFTGRYSSDPIVIDFDRDGLKFIDIAHSSAHFDVDGVARRSAWIGGGEGILAVDVDQDGRIERLDEIAFGSHVGQPWLSDLQALQNPLFDRNQDLVFDARDPMWSQFLVWQDLNGNGRSDAGELRSLGEAGIEALYLNANVLNRAEGPDVRVRGYTRVLMSDGSLLQAADVWLGLDNPDATDAATPEPSMQQVTQLGADQFAALLQQLAEAPQEGNRAPMVYGYLPVQFATEGQPFRLELAPNFFIDADTADRLRIDARLADGSPLPTWLRWDAEQLRLEGLPQAGDAGNLRLMLTATDGHGAGTHITFTMMTEPTPLLPADESGDAATVAADDLLPSDLALSRLLSSVASGTVDTGIAIELEATAMASAGGSFDLLSGFAASDHGAGSPPLFDAGNRAAADSAMALAGLHENHALSAWPLAGIALPLPTSPATTVVTPSAIAAPALP